ncbi:hypothetical protein VB711_09400 [Cronbergia sp. UHCC 0137]|uniref:hypothetical protein n=1 Tax=Cronbergia sp. UHCC 0137 TaxID=3110239 RepID=UPI002B2199B9|nr:hypothetical protein [Cronbergia sp. UHCC 0137]MEA5618050.1 hypothetical protein [Cronbergia sp. UHCC 0137]
MKRKTLIITALSRISENVSIYTSNSSMNLGRSHNAQIDPELGQDNYQPHCYTTTNSPSN